MLCFAKNIFWLVFFLPCLLPRCCDHGDLLYFNDYFCITGTLYRNTFILMFGPHRNPIQIDSNKKTFHPVSCSRSTKTSLCSDNLIVLENKCLFALRWSSPNMKPTFQLSDKMAVCNLAFWPIALPQQSWTYFLSWRKKLTKTKQKKIKRLLHHLLLCCICRSYKGNSASTWAMNGPDRCSFMMTALFLSFCKASTLTDLK